MVEQKSLTNISYHRICGRTMKVLRVDKITDNGHYLVKQGCSPLQIGSYLGKNEKP